MADRVETKSINTRFVLLKKSSSRAGLNLELIYNLKGGAVSSKNLRHKGNNKRGDDPTASQNYHIISSNQLKKKVEPDFETISSSKVNPLQTKYMQMARRNSGLGDGLSYAGQKN